MRSNIDFKEPTVRMIVRLAVADDVTDLVALNRIVQDVHVRAEPKYFSGEISNNKLDRFFKNILVSNNNEILIAEIAGISVGYLWFETQARPENLFKLALNRIYIHHIGVDERSHGRGIGAALVRAVEAEAEMRGIAHIAVDTWAFNANAQAFFQRLGFAPFNIAMRKELAGSP